MIYRILIALFFMALPELVIGQILLGPKVGINFSRQNRNEEYDMTKTGLQYGGVIIIPIKDPFSIQSEFLITQKGYRQEFGSEDLFDELSARYLEVPIYLKFTKEKLGVKFFVNGGVYLAYWTSGKLESSIDGSGEIIREDYEFTTEPDEDGFQDNRTDIGMSVGLGSIIPVSNSNLMIDFRYNYGFSDVNKLETEPEGYEKVTNRTFSITVAYLFFL